MVVPRLKTWKDAGKDLHESDAGLDQAARHQAAHAVRRGDGIIQAVQLPRGFGLLLQVQRFARRHLHSGRELVVFDAGVQRATGGHITARPAERAQVPGWRRDTSLTRLGNERNVVAQCTAHVAEAIEHV